jgi:hypothetical protein
MATAYTEPRIEALEKYAEHPHPESRPGKYLLALMTKLGVKTLPTWREMFSSHFAYALPAASLGEMAVFNDRTSWSDTQGSSGRLLNEISEYFSGDNILNPYAEIEIKQVTNILSALLVDRKLYNPIKGFVVTDLNAQDTDKTNNTYQIFDGRHRAIAMAILYGFKVRIPIWVDEEPIVKATGATLMMNQNRQIRKFENVAVNGLKTAHMSPTTDKQYASHKGSKQRIARWVAYQTHVAKNYKVFPKSALVVTERPTRLMHSMSAVNYQNAVNAMLGALSEEALMDFSQAKPLITKGLGILSAMFVELPKANKVPDFIAYFNAYSSFMWGTVIGESMMNDKVTDIEAEGKKLAVKAAKFVEKIGEDAYCRTPVVELLAQL